MGWRRMKGWTLDVEEVRTLLLGHGFWFIDVPRTSSTSIRTELALRYGAPFGKQNVLEQDYATTQYVPDHMTAQQLVALLGESTWKRIFTFTIVRNPWERVLSMYFYRRKKGSIPNAWSFTEFLSQLENPAPEGGFFRYHGHRLGAADYITGEHGEILVDHIIRYEERESGLELVRQNCRFPELGRMIIQRATPEKTPYAEHYNNHTKEVIERLYSRDIELFDYHFES